LPPRDRPVRLHRVDPAGGLSSGGHYSAPPLPLGAEPLSDTESRKVLFCEFVSLFCREPEQASGFPFILCQPAAAMLVEDAEAGLRRGEPLVGRELEEANGFPLILRKPAAASRVGGSEIELRRSVPLIGGQLEEASGFVE